MPQPKQTRTKPAAEPEPYRPQGAAAKLAHIQGQVSDVVKSGRHQQGYSYIQEHKVIELLRPFLRELRCSVVVEATTIHDLRSTKIGNKDGWLVTLNGTLTFTDSEAPEYLEDGKPNPDRRIHAEYTGQGADHGDKATGKAQTYLTKYALQKFFLIPTEGIDDADTTDTSGATAAAEPAQPMTREELPLHLADPAALERIRTALKDAGAEPNRVKGKLVDLGVATIDDLPFGKLEAFEAWVLEETSKAAA